VKLKWLVLVYAALFVVTACGAKFASSIRRQASGTFYVVVEDPTKRDVTVVITGLNTINAAMDSAKVRLGNFPGVPTDIKSIRIMVDTQATP
jgi:hypothetical protein